MSVGREPVRYLAPNGFDLSKKLFLLSTESSGDLLGSRLVRELKKTIPNLSIAGVGGDRLIDEGMTAYHHVRDFNVMGLFEVISQLKRLKAIFADLVEQVVATKPDCILLIDAPDFNLRFAKAIKKYGIPIVYYVSPQVWAWRAKRAKAIAGLVDHMMVLYEFEKDIYRELGLATTWVGHPLVDEIDVAVDRDAFFKRHGLDPEKPLVGLAPGSRPSEVKKLLPVMREIACARADRYQFVLPLAETITVDYAKQFLEGDEIPILPGLMRPVMAFADAAVVASGTATLETALLGTPMIVGYKLKTLTYFMARKLVKIPHFAMVNIVLGKEVVPELVQHHFSAIEAAALLDELIEPGPSRNRIILEFDKLKAALGGGGASKRAAATVAAFLEAGKDLSDTN